MGGGCGAQGPLGEGLGLVGVDPHRLVRRPEQCALADQVRGGGAGRQLRLQGAAGGERGDAEAAEGGGGAGRVGVESGSVIGPRGPALRLGVGGGERGVACRGGSSGAGGRIPAGEKISAD
ncbi:hypothetical protein ACWD3I_09885 [Streptomyces sp. NPDC002817]